MRKIHGKKFWSVAITIAFLLNSVPYPAYGMKMLGIENAFDGKDAGGGRDKKLNKQIFDIAYQVGGKGLITHEMINLVLRKLFNDGKAGNIYGFTPEEFKEITAEPCEELTKAIKEYKSDVEKAVERVDKMLNERYGDKFTKKIDIKNSRIALFKIKDGDEVERFFGHNWGYRYEHAGRAGKRWMKDGDPIPTPVVVYQDVDMFSHVAEVSREVLNERLVISNLPKGIVPLDLLLLHPILELRVRDILKEYLVSRNYYKKIFNKPEKIKESKYETIRQLAELEIRQEDIDIAIWQIEIDEGIIDPFLPHKLTQKIPWANLDPIQHILDEQIAKDISTGKFKLYDEQAFEESLKRGVYKAEYDIAYTVLPSLLEKKLRSLFRIVEKEFGEGEPDGYLEVADVLEDALRWHRFVWVEGDDAYVSGREERRLAAIKRILNAAKEVSAEFGLVLNYDRGDDGIGDFKISFNFDRVTIAQKGPRVIEPKELDVAYSVEGDKVAKTEPVNEDAGTVSVKQFLKFWVRPAFKGGKRAKKMEALLNAMVGEIRGAIGPGQREELIEALLIETGYNADRIKIAALVLQRVINSGNPQVVISTCEILMGLSEERSEEEMMKEFYAHERVIDSRIREKVESWEHLDWIDGKKIAREKEAEVEDAIAQRDSFIKKRAIAYSARLVSAELSRRFLAHHEPVVEIPEWKISKIISAEQAAKQASEVYEVYAELRTFFEQTKEGTDLALATRLKLEKTDKSLSPNQQGVIVVPEEFMAETKRVLGDNFSHISFLTPSQSMERIAENKKKGNVRMSAITPEDSLEVSTNEGMIPWCNEISEEWTTTLGEVGENEVNTAHSVMLTHFRCLVSSEPIVQLSPETKNLLMLTYKNNGIAEEEAASRIEAMEGANLADLQGFFPVDHATKLRREETREMLGEAV